MGKVIALLYIIIEIIFMEISGKLWVQKSAEWFRATFIGLLLKS
jgi:hypothetical protein